MHPKLEQYLKKVLDLKTNIRGKVYTEKIKTKSYLNKGVK